MENIKVKMKYDLFMGDKNGERVYPSPFMNY